MTETDLDHVIENYKQALRELVKGNPEPVLAIWTHQEEVSLANPLGPVVQGWKQVEETGRRVASGFLDGELEIEVIVKRVTPGMAFLVWMEHTKARINHSEMRAAFTLRVTSIFERQDGTWRLVHRHADPINSARPLESLIQQ